MIFQEVQRFRQAWMWVLVSMTMLAAVGTFGYGMVKQLLMGQPWGTNPMSDGALLLVGTLAMVTCLGLSWLLWAMKLVTEVRADGLHLRFFPLASRHIPYDEIEACAARTYRPIAEYGGWGIRFGWGSSGTAWNVSGTRGVQLKLKQGRPLLIGSQLAEDLAAAIDQHR